MARPRIQIFREEALEQASGRPGGDVLRLSPRWTRWAYWVLVIAFATAAVYCASVSLHEYASGPAVVWISGRTHVTATVTGTVSAIDVQPGQVVEPGQLLVRFASPVELAELQRIDREFELQLGKSLRDPADQAAREALVALRTQRDVAAARLEQHSVRAPQAGVIGDIRIRSGQLIEAGNIVLTLVGHDTRCSVMAMLPAHYRPQLRPGLSMRFEANGYRYAYQSLQITAVGGQIIGPDEVKRYLGQEIGDTISVQGPVVLVEATPATSTLLVDGQSFELYHGMSGLAEAQIRTENILLSLFPSLRVVLQRLHG
ncbi:efflux RND transporter periplasmic adaptor subunit [Sorangium sp. So ce1151]|uniref:efflux RND transporter periplasmic adaptor subunit n=1 Tax=Sorangium sp. So ce1151 TaxID=3133332 RepID=UPI003F6084C0